MKTYYEIETLMDAFEGHSDEEVPPELSGADKMTAIAVLRWVLDMSTVLIPLRWRQDGEGKRLP